MSKSQLKLHCSHLKFKHWWSFTMIRWCCECGNRLQSDQKMHGPYIESPPRA